MKNEHSMEFKRNADQLMSQIRINDAMHRTIMEGNAMKKKNGFTWKRTVASAAALAVMVSSTMYVAAAYMEGNTSLRELFMAREDSALKVPEAQQMPDLYGQIVDSRLPDSEDSSSKEDGTVTTPINLDNYGEMIIDNELFSIELLETTCAGRELVVSYILTQKTENLSVSVAIESAEYAQWLDGTMDYETYKEISTLALGFEDSYEWNRLPENCGYELSENQQLRMYTQLGNREYASGTYTMYVNYHTWESPQSSESSESFVMSVSEEDALHYFSAPIEIVGNENYGLALSGAIDKQERNVHFDKYDIYVSPLNVYLTLDGTYQGEMSSIWGAQSSHDITVTFRDGSSTTATVLLSGMGYGSNTIDVDMHTADRKSVV